MQKMIPALTERLRWSREYQDLGPAADEPLTDTEDLTARSDQDLKDGIEDLKTQIARFSD